MKYVLFCSVAVLAATPVIVSAEVTGALGLSYSRTTVDGFDDALNNTKLEFELSYQGAGPIGFGFSGGTSRISEDGDGMNLTDLTGDLSYGFGNGYQAGVYAGSLSLSGDFLDETLTAYGGFFGMSGDQYGFDLSFGKLENDGFDANEASLRGHFNVSDQTVLTGNVGRFWEDGIELNMVGFGVNHAFSTQGSVFGGLQRISGDLGGSITTFSVGLAYDLAVISSFGATGWIELSRTSYDDGPSLELDRVAFGLALPLGEGAVTAPLGSLTGAIGTGGRSGYFSVYTDGILGIF